MHETHSCGPAYRDDAARPYATGLAQLRTGRRVLIAGAAASAAGVAFSASAASAAGTSAAASPKRAYVLVTDGCRPGEISSTLTPNLFALRAGGLHLPKATSLPVMETIPNHVMMMTGQRPDRTGVPANTIYDRPLGAVRTMDQPDDIAVPTIIERLRARGYRTGTVLSKEYLYGVFGERAGQRWEPSPTLPITEHAPDIFTVQAAIAMLQDYDPHLMFVNLGDIDRFGHADLTGTTLQVARRLALADTDLQVGRFLDAVKSAGHWENAMVIVLADHSMDWSLPLDFISLQSGFDADDLLAGNVTIADNGGADLCYWTGPAAKRRDAVARMERIARATDGVLSTHRPASLRLGPNAGDLVVYCEPGRRFSDPSNTSNPIPGNHGHPATEPIPFFIGGGHPRVPKAVKRSTLTHTYDVAPTVASFFGLSTRPYEGRAHL